MQDHPVARIDERTIRGDKPDFRGDETEAKPAETVRLNLFGPEGAPIFIKLVARFRPKN